MEIRRHFSNVLEQRIHEQLNFIQVVLGPRQVGKTTGVRQVFEQWPGPKIWADADSPAPPDSEWIIGQWNRARSLDREVLLVFDEIQKIPGWSDIIKGLFDQDRRTRRLRVVLLGSASLSLDVGLTDSLAGRFELIKVPHWSLNESREAFGWGVDDYVIYGGYPAPAELLPDTERWRQFMLSSIIEPVISRDILGLVQIRKPALFRQTFELAMQYPAQPVSYQKLIGQLQDAGNVATVQNYLQILEDAFVLKLISKFSGSVFRQKATSPKIVPCAPALLHAFTHPSSFNVDSSWRGKVIESVVGAVLCSKYEKVAYWSKGHAEVDYIVQHQHKLFAVEVKSGRPRKNSGMSRFIREQPKAIPVVISERELSSFLADGDLEAVHIY